MALRNGLVEVLKRIYRTLNEEQGIGQLARIYTKKAAQERIFGFELLPAPFVVAHLQLGPSRFRQSLPSHFGQKAYNIYLNDIACWETCGNYLKYDTGREEQT